MCLGPLLRQHRPWSTRASTAFPDGQVCGSQALHSSLWATATLTASSDSLRPTEAMDGACSQSPEWGDAAAKSLTSPAALERSKAWWFFVTGLSHAFWICNSSSFSLFLNLLFLCYLTTSLTMKILFWLLGHPTYYVGGIIFYQCFFLSFFFHFFRQLISEVTERN